MCDVRVAAHTQNCPKNGPLKARLMAWAVKLREKISQPASAKQYISPFISLYFKPLFLVLISVLSKLSKESLRQGGLRCCSLENIYLLFYLRWRKVGTEYSQETAASDSEDDSCQCNNCYLNFGTFVHVHRCPSSSPIQSRPSVIVAWLMGLQKQDKGTTSIGKVQGSLRIGFCLTDKVSFD